MLAEPVDGLIFGHLERFAQVVEVASGLFHRLVLPGGGPRPDAFGEQGIPGFVGELEAARGDRYFYLQRIGAEQIELFGLRQRKRTAGTGPDNPRLLRRTRFGRAWCGGGVDRRRPAHRNVNLIVRGLHEHAVTDLGYARRGVSARTPSRQE